MDQDLFPSFACESTSLQFPVVCIQQVGSIIGLKRYELRTKSSEENEITKLGGPPISHEGVVSYFNFQDHSLLL